MPSRSIFRLIVVSMMSLAGARGHGAEPLPTVVVEAQYPGADSRTVVATVAVPIEQQVNGSEHMLHMRSRSSVDGSYVLTVTFQPGPNLKFAPVDVENRVRLALPVLADAVRQQGVRTRWQSHGAQLITLLVPTDGRFDETYMARYAKLQIADKLAAISGVARVRVAGDSQGSGGESRPTPDDAPRRGGYSLYNGNPAAVIFVSLSEGESSTAAAAEVRSRLAELRTGLPAGLSLELFFDSTAETAAKAFLASDVVLPYGASTERTFEVVRRYEYAARKIEGVRDVLALSGSSLGPGSNLNNVAQVFFRLNSAGGDRVDRETVVRSVRNLFPGFEEVLLRLRDPAASSLPGGDYALRLAIHTNTDAGADAMQSAAYDLIIRLREQPGLTDVFTDFRGAVPIVRLVIEHEKAARLQVPIEQIRKSIQSVVGGHPPEETRELTAAFRSATVTDGRGKTIPLESVVRAVAETAPTAIERLDLMEMSEITANAAPGVSIAEARALCEAAARATLPPEFSFTWLSPVPSVTK